MPNYVTNIVKAAPNVLAAAMRDSTPEERGSAWQPAPDKVFDFGLLIPPPDHPDYSDPKGCAHQHPWSGNPGPEEHPNCWYVWNRENWGVKWNASTESIEALPGDMAQVRFDTAWSHPVPVIEALSRKFPDDLIEVAYADEDFGANCALYSMQGGEFVMVYQPDDFSDEGKELAAKVKYNRTYAELEKEWAE